MDADLAELYERLDYCDREAATLQREMLEFGQRAAETRVVSNVTGEWAYVMEVRLRQPLPVSLRSRIGMLINEGRVILDNLANVLAERNGKTTSSSVYFPISKSQEIFETDGYRKMRDLSPQDQETIGSIRPYSGGDPLLFILHELDRRRKHFKLNAKSAKVGPSSMPFPRFGGIDLINPESITEEFAPFLWFSDPRCGQIEFELAIFVTEPPVANSSNLAYLLPQLFGRVRSVVDLFNRS